MKRIVRNMLLAFVSVSALLIAIATLTYINMNDLMNREKINTKSLLILRTIEDIQLSSLNVETGMRGYLIVGDTAYLNPYYKGKEDLSVKTNQLIEYSEDYKDLKSEAVLLKLNISHLITISEVLITDENFKNTDTLKRMRLLKISSIHMAAIRKITGDIESNERIVLSKSNIQNIVKARLTKYGFFATAFVAIMILIIVFFIIRKDLHRRRVTEKRLTESSNRIVDLYNKAPCGYHSVSKDNIVIEMNDTELAWLGYTREEVIGRKSIFEFVHKEDHPKIFDVIEQINKSKIAILKDLEIRFVRKDGICFDVILNSKFDYDKSGNFKNTRTVVLDITELKSIQEKVRQLNEELKVNNIQLIEINSELESFSYSVSHDLRAPLRAIDGYCKIIEEDYAAEMNDEAKRVLSIIMSNAKKMGVLIDDLLDFSKLGRIETTNVKVENGKIIEEIITELKVPSKYIFDIEPLDDAYADRKLIKQVWSNLISNSIKYTSKLMKPFIRISSYKNNDEVVYCIEDNGVGFDEKYKHKLFEVFQRLHHEDEYEGTGVGLAIVHKIITKHKGRVWAESRPEDKTRFYFSLPNKGQENSQS